MTDMCQSPSSKPGRRAAEEQATALQGPRRWRMWAGEHRTERGMTEPVEWRHFALDPSYARAYGEENIVEVDVVEDPDGLYMGWVTTGEATVGLLQRRAALFGMQFAYGPEVEVEAGRGVIIRAHVSPVEAGGDQGGRQ